MEIPIWWYNNVLAVGMQKMKTWQVTGSWCSSYHGSSRDVSSTTSPELKMKQQMHCQSSDPPGKRYQPEYRWKTFTSHLSSLPQNQSQSSFRRPENCRAGSTESSQEAEAREAIGRTRGCRSATR